MMEPIVRARKIVQVHYEVCVLCECSAANMLALPEGDMVDRATKCRECGIDLPYDEIDAEVAGA